MSREILDILRGELLALPELRNWPVAASFLSGQREPRLACWELPLAACAAVGAPPERAHPAAAATLAMLLGIHVVDDMLDDEPDGLFRRAGVGMTANLALALQGAAIALVADADLEPGARAAATRSLGETALATAYGQWLDTLPVREEADYWRAVDAKTPPLFQSALYTGALSGGASISLAEQVGAIGQELGRLIQVSDDLKDAFERAIAPDWRRRTSNLALLFAGTAQHPDRARFLALLDSIDDAGALEEAQSILIRSGAVAYCVYNIVNDYRRAEQKLRALDLADPAPLTAVLRAHVEPVAGLLRSVGVEAPERLLSV